MSYYLLAGFATLAVVELSRWYFQKKREESNRRKKSEEQYAADIKVWEQRQVDDSKLKAKLDDLVRQAEDLNQRMTKLCEDTIQDGKETDKLVESVDEMEAEMSRAETKCALNLTAMVAIARSTPPSCRRRRCGLDRHWGYDLQ